MQRVSRLLAAGLLVLTALVLAGCAGGFLLDNRVRTFTQPPPIAAGAAYRLERLPSQQQAGALQDQVEAFAEPVLRQAGLRRDDAAARYSVQVTARVQRVLSPYADPWDGFGWGMGFGGRGFGIGFGGFGFPRMEQPWFQREVGIVIRELPGNRVVYETSAFNEGPWLDNTVVLPVMFQAALQGFPNPPVGERKVDIHVPPAGQAAKP